MGIAALSGFVAGFIHVLSGPDHLAAVAPLAADSGRRQWLTGLDWGFGHTSGVLLVGVLALLLRELIPVDALSSWGERLVGIVLISIGLWGLRRAMRLKLHVHPHRHDGRTHEHVHVHAGPAAHETEPAAPGHIHSHAHTHAAFAVGVLHGLAGSSHLLGVLPALAFPTRAESIAYLASFGVATVLAMTAFAAVIGFLARRARAGGAVFYRNLLYACSLAAIAVGGVWLLL
jgi:ABC-type nickel/cobalt efflux system permease component RcnA